MHHEFALIPNWTIAIQLGLFLASFLSLHFLVFKPFQALIHTRHEKTTGLKQRAVEANEKAAKLKDEYESFMRNERKNTALFLETERRKISEAERAIIQSARDEVAEELGTLRKNVKVEADKARVELLKLVPEYSSLIASKLTGQKIKVSGVKIEPKEGQTSEQPLL